VTKDIETKNTKRIISAEFTDGTLKVTCSEGGKTEAHELYNSMFGVNNEAVFDVLLSQVMNTTSTAYSNDAGANYIISMLLELKPQNGLEAMLISQMIATHNMSMEMSKRATLSEQTVEGVSENVKRSVKLMQTFTAQLTTLQKMRNKGQQVIQVQHVNVESGGQAIVGNIEAGRG